MARMLFQSGEYGIVECLSCKQVRTESSGKVKRKNFYGAQDISVYLEKEVMFRALFGQVISFIKRFISSGKLVDIGAGVGLLVDEANKAGFQAIGFEPSKVSVFAAKKYFGVTLLQKFRRVDANVVVINHVLEHVPDPKKLLTDITEGIQRNGFLFVGVPNFGSFIAKLKKSRWQSLIPDQHRWHFTLSTLDNMITTFGFELVGARYENHDRFMHPWWKRSIYAILDTIALSTGHGEAMLVAYRKV